MQKWTWSLLVTLAVAGVAGCSNVGEVKAWEKGNLAKLASTLDGDPLDRRYTEHIYASKENSSGGAGVGGGGCGCN